MLIAAAASTFAQKRSWQVDKLRVATGATLGYQPLKVRGIDESVDNPGTYEMKDAEASFTNILLQAEVVLPFYRTDAWSVGARAGAALGLQMVSQGVKGLEDLNGSVVYDFPQFLYYRNYQTSFDFTVLAGYKYTKASFSTHFALAGLEVQLMDSYSIRGYGSLNSYQYYLLYTDGREEPALTIREFGISLMKSF
ncbi:hypothetical protein GU926_11945 [Nibribacter ruber]|uniref:Uncharacterized protein n=1 Tax=Nibribacter ruber TaxID=2698458 RepID=A0A6P1NZX6_9BACT|nr:hypothetical protein [Nibribacter ruber]QHL88104.1 hypothetical protein GU926_11945 [Nibribacter ruber]